MKKLLLVLAGLGLATSAYAADDTQWKHNGEVRVFYKNTKNTAFEKSPKMSQDKGGWFQRTKFGVTANKGENLSASVTMLAAGAWGRNFGAGDARDSIALAAEKNTVGLLEGYIWWKPSDMFSLRMGRGGFTIADGAVVSINDTEQVPVVFDGVLGTFDFGFANMHVFGVKGAELAENATGLVYDKEHNFYGASFDFKNLPDFLKTANVHFIKENKDVWGTTVGTHEGSDNLRYGLTLSGDMSGFDYKATYAGLNGKERSTTLDKNNDVKTNASMFDLAAGYTLAEMMNTRIGVQYHMDSGDNDEDNKTDNTYEPFFYDRSPYAGAMDIIGWGNSTYLGAFVSMKPQDNTTVGLNYYMFSRTSDKAQVSTPGSDYSFAGTWGTAANKKKPIGSELDLWAKHTYEGGFEVVARYSMFTAGDFIKEHAGGTAPDSISQLKVQGTLRF